MTSLQVIDTGEVVEQMTRVEAERITARIADKLDGIADNIEQVMPLIREALTREAWKPLGYSGATAYVSERFAGAFGRLPAAVRQPIVSELSSAGMSTRAIAPIVGVSNKTVHQDMQVLPRVTPEPPPAFVETTTGEVYDGFQDAIAKAEEEVVEQARKVHGMDGKTYVRPEPMSHLQGRQERRTPLYITARSAGTDLRKAVERIEKVMSDDRLGQNKEQVAELISVYLSQAVEVCQDSLDQLN